jgi:CDGSH-type Zn-finger protein
MEREVVVELCPDGPALVRGPATFVGPDGEPLPRRRATVAVCRCRGTRTPPWCDGTHRVLDGARRAASLDRPQD